VKHDLKVKDRRKRHKWVKRDSNRLSRREPTMAQDI